MKKQAVIIYGPPGAGKGTQAELLSRRFGFVHFDTGRYIEQLLNSSQAGGDSELQKEKELFDKGVLNTPSWVLGIVSSATEKISQADSSIVYSGSPRTYFEAFGDENHRGLISVLDNVYGKENVNVVFIDVPEEVSIKRNSARVICSVCGLPIMAGSNIEKCVFCGGKPKKRTLDKPDVIKVRLKEFKERTFPILERVEEGGYSVLKIDGTPLPYEVHNSIVKKLNLNN